MLSSYLASAARCHAVLAASPASPLRPLSQLQYTGEVLFHTPIPSATRLASLWRQLAIDMREFDDPSLQHHPAKLHLSPATVTKDIQTLHPLVTTTITSVRASALFDAADQPAHRARMHSLRFRHARAYLDTVPVSSYFRLSDADLTYGGPVSYTHLTLPTILLV